MSTTSLQKRSASGAIAVRKFLGKFEALLFLPSLAYGFLRFDANGELQATTIPRSVTNYTADGAISLREGVHTIAKTSAAAMTVAAPTAAQAGLRMTIVSNTDFAHVITFTGSTLLDGTEGANLTVTMTAFKGSAIVVVAVGTKWLLESSSNVTSIVA